MIVETQCSTGQIEQMQANELLLPKRKEHGTQGPLNTPSMFAEKAEGAVITDVEGKSYIDFTGSIGVDNIGHCNKDVSKTIQDQTMRVHSPLFPCGDVRILRRISEITHSCANRF
jgi:4-aminobutyrate aminotransferase-like enzyme